MSKPKVYVTREIPERGLKMIEKHFNAEVWSEYGPPLKEVIIEKVRDVDALVSLLSDKIDVEVFDEASKLKIVAQMAVGFDNIDVKEATKRGIYVTNTPEVLTETTADFAWALLMKEGWIAGAGLDVFEREPSCVDNLLLKLGNVVVAPHISSSSHETRSRMAEMVAENLIAFFEGKIPPNLVNREVLKIRKQS